MICLNCHNTIEQTNTSVKCSICLEHLHDYCASSCSVCGAYLCDTHALNNKFKCTKCKASSAITMDVISSTMFESYEKCPHLFFNEYIDNNISEEDRQNKYSIIGNLLHDLFEKYSQIRPLDESQLEAILTEYRIIYFDLNPELFTDDDDITNTYNIHINTINNWFKWEQDNELPYTVEEKHYFDIEGIDIPVRTTIDRIQKFDDEYEVWDYKTGKVYSSDKLRHNLQLPIYAEYIYKTYGKYPRKLKLIFPQHNDPHGKVITREFNLIADGVYMCVVHRGGTYTFTVSDKLKKVVEIWDKIKSGDFTHNTSNSHFCYNFCPLGKQKICDAIHSKWIELSNRCR